MGRFSHLGRRPEPLVSVPEGISGGITTGKRKAMVDFRKLETRITRGILTELASEFQVSAATAWFKSTIKIASKMGKPGVDSLH